MFYYSFMKKKQAVLYKKYNVWDIFYCTILENLCKN